MPGSGKSTMCVKPATDWAETFFRKLSQTAKKASIGDIIPQDYIN